MLWAEYQYQGREQQLKNNRAFKVKFMMQRTANDDYAKYNSHRGEITSMITLTEVCLKYIMFVPNNLVAASTLQDAENSCDSFSIDTASSN